MRQTILLALSCALVGGIAGAGVVLWVTPRGNSSAVSVGGEGRAEDSEGAAEAQLIRRVESVERAVRSLQARGPAAPGLAGAAPSSARAGSAGVDPGEASAGAATAAPNAVVPPVGDPVFEAAVLDVIERAEEDRDSQRDVRRSERARQQAEHWTQELTGRLSLSADQAAKLLEIRTQLALDLREQRETQGERFIPREQRRAAREALRERAEKQLRSVLRSDQVARYDDLEDELKIVRPPDDD